MEQRRLCGEPYGHVRGRDSRVPRASSARGSLVESVIKPDSAGIQRRRFETKPWRAHEDSTTEPSHVSRTSGAGGVALAALAASTPFSTPVSERFACSGALRHRQGPDDVSQPHRIVCILEAHPSPNGSLALAGPRAGHVTLTGRIPCVVRRKRAGSEIRAVTRSARHPCSLTSDCQKTPTFARNLRRTATHSARFEPRNPPHRHH